MLKSIWKLLLMFNGVSSEDDEREARRARLQERRRSEAEANAEAPRNKAAARQPIDGEGAARIAERR
jgi:hypothetical protein